jgi:lipoprotein-anchoring transpeptidase ErfK/SrfK
MPESRSVTRRRPIALLTAIVAAAVGASSAIAAQSSAAIAADDGQDPAGAATAPAPQTTTTTTSIPKPTHRARLARARPANMKLHVVGIGDGKLVVGKKVRAVGYLHPFVRGQHVRVKLARNGHVVKKMNPYVKQVKHRNVGRFKFRSGHVVKPGHYRVTALHVGNDDQDRDWARSRGFKIRYPDPDPGDRNSTVKTFNNLLLDQGYYTTHGKHYGQKTEFAVMAFRKVNGMKRTFNASPGIFKKLADGRGEFNLEHPGAGKHVEVDISKQVMVLANHRKPQYTIHVSTGAPATPTIRGHYRFYSRQPGFNSSGMYYSVYWHGGYAIHGYHSVPPYPASHGCVRNPIPESVFIYDWVKIGMSIYVYG